MTDNNPEAPKDLTPIEAAKQNLREAIKKFPNNSFSKLGKSLEFMSLEELRDKTVSIYLNPEGRSDSDETPLSISPDNRQEIQNMGDEYTAILNRFSPNSLSENDLKENSERISVLLSAERKEENIGEIRDLIRRGFDNDDGYKLSSLAACNSYYELIEPLRSKTKISQNLTALHIAVVFGTKEVVSDLIKLGSDDINARSTPGSTALNLALDVDEIDKEKVELLISKGAVFNSFDLEFARKKLDKDDEIRQQIEEAAQRKIDRHFYEALRFFDGSHDGITKLKLIELMEINSDAEYLRKPFETALKKAASIQEDTRTSHRSTFGTMEYNSEGGAEVQSTAAKKIAQKFSSVQSFNPDDKTTEEVFNDAEVEEKERIEFAKTQALLEMQIIQKDKVMDNKLARALKKLQQAELEKGHLLGSADDTKSLHKGHLSVIFKQHLTTLDRKILVDYYNSHHPRGEMAVYPEELDSASLKKSGAEVSLEIQTIMRWSIERANSRDMIQFAESTIKNAEETNKKLYGDKRRFTAASKSSKQLTSAGETKDKGSIHQMSKKECPSFPSNSITGAIVTALHSSLYKQMH